MQAFICYDLRTFDNQESSARMTAEAIEQIAWADDKPFDAVLLPEHHGSPDGYLPSPFMLGAAMAARTSRIRVVTAAVLLPLLDPIRVAEDSAVLDNISQGRLTLGVGLGYAPPEFEMFGVAYEDRVRRLEEGIAVLRQAFTGEEFSYRGRTARVAPRPVQPGGPPILVCGAVKATARRAARLGDGFFPSSADLRQEYLDECHRLGKPAGPIYTLMPPLCVHVAEDPERAWAMIAPHAAHETAAYGQWAKGAAEHSDRMDSHYHDVRDYDAVRALGVHAVVTPQQCVELVRNCEQNGYLVNFKPLMGGMPPELGWESLELFVNKVVPMLEASQQTPLEAADHA
jgi:alkanesulfonate monooxygenase SsuD/methylene tetrahydromethanopterin reductase-like flavin-dependent oxidoreductase (luciferase family)